MHIPSIGLCVGVITGSKKNQLSISSLLQSWTHNESAITLLNVKNFKNVFQLGILKIPLLSPMRRKTSPRTQNSSRRAATQHIYIMRLGYIDNIAENNVLSFTFRKKASTEKRKPDTWTTAYQVGPTKKDYLQFNDLGNSRSIKTSPALEQPLLFFDIAPPKNGSNGINGHTGMELRVNESNTGGITDLLGLSRNFLRSSWQMTQASHQSLQRWIEQRHLL